MKPVPRITSHTCLLDYKFEVKSDAIARLHLNLEDPYEYEGPDSTYADYYGRLCSEHKFYDVLSSIKNSINEADRYEKISLLKKNVLYMMLDEGNLKAVKFIVHTRDFEPKFEDKNPYLYPSLLRYSLSLRDSILEIQDELFAKIDEVDYADLLNALCQGGHRRDNRSYEKNMNSFLSRHYRSLLQASVFEQYCDNRVLVYEENFILAEQIRIYRDRLVLEDELSSLLKNPVHIETQSRSPRKMKI